MPAIHLYAYNETEKPLRLQVRFMPVGGESLTEREVDVPSGLQKMLCTTEQPAVSTRGLSADASYIWTRLDLSLQSFEQTLALASASGTGKPPQWPSPWMRQFAFEKPS